MFKYGILFLFSTILIGQAQDTLVKYFPTDIQRSEILNSKVSEKDVKGKAHFKSTYSEQGKLLNVEYIPGKKKGREKLSNLKLYYGYWDIEIRNLADGLTRDQLDGKNYYEATFNNKGRIKTVTFIDRNKRRLWSYVLKWNKAGTKSKYSVEFHVREPLTLFDEFLYADELSEMRRGWSAEMQEREDNRPHTVTITDKLGQVYYYYTLQYMDGGEKSSIKEIIVSEYFRDDSTKVGMHKLFYNRREYLQKTEFYDSADKLIYTNVYNYSNAPKELMLTSTDNRGKLLEKRIISFSKKYKRHLGPPKDKTGLADVMLYLDVTSEGDLHKLVQSIESKFDVTVEMDTLVQKNIVEVEPEIELEKETIVLDMPKVKKSDKIVKKFTAVFNINREIIAGRYLDSGKVNTIGFDLTFPNRLELFWFSLQGGLGLEYVSFNSGDNAWGTWVFVESADFIPFPFFPIVINSGLGKVGSGLGLRSGIYAGREIGPVKLAVGTNAVILNNIDGTNNVTGYLAGNVSIMYPFNFPKINIPIPWFK